MTVRRVIVAGAAVLVGCAARPPETGTPPRRSPAPGSQAGPERIARRPSPRATRSTAGAPTPKPPSTHDARVVAWLLRHRPFEVLKGRKVHLYYLRGTEVEQQRRAILHRREQALQRLERFFGRRVPRPVRILMFTRFAKMWPLRDAQVYPGALALALCYGEGRHAYERNHPGALLTLLFTGTDAQWRPVRVEDFLETGLADHLSGNPVSLHLLASHQRDYLTFQRRRDIHLAPGYLTKHGHRYDHLAGSFVRFLITRQFQGAVRFRLLLQAARLPGATSSLGWKRFTALVAQHYGKTFATLEREWNALLRPHWRQPYPLPPADRQALERQVRQAQLGGILRLQYKRNHPNLQLLVITRKTSSTGKHRCGRALAGPRRWSFHPQGGCW